MTHLAQPGALIPAELLQEAGVITQLAGELDSTPPHSNHQDAITVYDWANEYQQTNTSFRHGNLVRTGANTGVNQNLEHARSYAERINKERKEMKDKRALEVAGSVNVHVHGYKWSTEAGGSSNKTKMKKVVSCSPMLRSCPVDISLIVRLRIWLSLSLLSRRGRRVRF